jgi:hypothetical protein
MVTQTPLASIFIAKWCATLEEETLITIVPTRGAFGTGGMW